MDSAPITVLVADDELVVRSLVQSVLQRHGFSVLLAADGVEALEVSRAHSGDIHILLTDLRMPRMNGVDLSREVLRERPGIRVLMMTGEASEEIHRPDIQLPLLRKPFTPEPLLEMLRRVLEGPLPAAPQSA